MQRYGYSHKSTKILRILTFELRIFGWFLTMDGGFGKTAAYKERIDDRSITRNFLELMSQQQSAKPLFLGIACLPEIH